MARRRAPARAVGPKTLTIDVGRAGVKAAILNGDGRMMTERRRTPTPDPCPPEALISAVSTLVEGLGTYDRVSIGFPGAVRDGRVLTAPNLGSGKAWAGYDLAAALTRALGRPTRVLNDADMQGAAVIEGRGLELVITLGTGMGSAVFRDGELMPHLELGQHPLRKGKTYDEYVGNDARRKIGKRRWNRRVERAIGQLQTLLNYDRLHIGGGNASKLTIERDRRTRLVPNRSGLLGGIAPWR